MKKFVLPNLDEEKTALKSIRIKLTTLSKVNELSKLTDISVNRIFNECIEFAIENLDTDNLKLRTKAKKDRN